MPRKPKNIHVPSDESDHENDLGQGDDFFKNLSFMNSGTMGAVLLRLYMKEPFLGTISMYLSKIADANQPTLYVGVKRKVDKTLDQKFGVILGYNRNFVESLNEDHLANVLRHEFYHIVLHHIFSRMPKDIKEARLWNIAVDLCVNYAVSNIDPKSGKEADAFEKVRKCLPDGLLYPGIGQIGKRPEETQDPDFFGLIQKMPVGLAAEVYYRKLREFAEQNPNSPAISSMSDIEVGIADGHGGWGELSESEAQQMKMRVDQLVRKAGERAMKEGWGTVPSQMQEEIAKLLSSEVDWRSLVRNFWATAKSTNHTTTIRRINRRCPGLMPGFKRDEIAKFAFFIDQSGSMGNEDVASGFGNVTSLCQTTGAAVDVYNFDTEVDEDSHKVWKAGRAEAWGRTRCGGTDFNAIRHFLAKPENRRRWSGIIIFTDGYADTLGPMPAGVRVLWVITPSGTKNIVRQGDLVVQLTNV